MITKIVELKPYCVRVSATYITGMQVYAECEEDAIELVQEICDRTDLLHFLGYELENIEAEDAFEIPPFDQSVIRGPVGDDDD